MRLILTVFGFLCFINAVMNKYNLYEAIGLWASRQGSKFLYKAGNCKFCISVYLSAIITIIVSLIVGPELVHITIPFIVAGLFNVLDKQ